MIDSSDFRTKRMPLNHGAGHMPVLGFGTLIPGCSRDDKCYQRRAGSWISTLRLCGTISE